MENNEFVLTNGNKFVRKDIDGKWRQVTNLSLAETFKTQREAKNILLNSIPKAWSRTYYIGQVSGSEIIQCGTPRPQKAVKKPRTSAVVLESKFIETRWSKSFDGLVELFESAAERANQLSQELSDVEAKIVDLEHYLEFKTLNACDGYKLYKELREAFCKRRSIKDEMVIVAAINNGRCALPHISNITATINNCRKRVYKPRVLEGLFACNDIVVG